MTAGSRVDLPHPYPAPDRVAAVTRRSGVARRRRAHATALLTTLTGLAMLTGCVRRTMTITTDPQDARVFLNDEPLGSSPVSVDFTWYGDYDVVIRKEGYETLQTHHRLSPPWYQIPPIDFFAEALLPVTLHDERQISFTLEPAQPIDTAELLDDAEAFRDRTLYATE